ncbi:MAG: hypothetical protein GY853_14165 [PVC group bacterium]|nr:hypothetical protein [PVC group bacterium]
MIKLSGHLVRKPRAQIAAPVDGCHRNGSDGFLKGAHAMYLNGKLFMPHGMVSIYYYTSGDKGLKIYVSAKHGWHSKKKYVRAVRNRMKKYHEKGICPKPYKIISVEVDFNYKNKAVYHKKVWGLEVDHCFWPEDFEDYANGYPLTWCEGKYPGYSPEGFKKFKKKLDKILSHEDKKTLRKLGDSYKCGDVMYCTKKLKWEFVDLG